MQLDKHPIMKQGYELMQTIEQCGASEKLTQAVTQAGALMDEVERLVDRLAVYEKSRTDLNKYPQ